MSKAYKQLTIDMIQILGAATIYLSSVVVYHNETPKEIISPVEDVQVSGTVEVVLESPSEISDVIERYIRDVFPEEPDIMVATFKHENGYQLRNGWDEKHITYNNHEGGDGSADTGIAKINDSNKVYCRDLDIMEYKGNIDCARRIYDMQGKNAWYSYVFEKYEMFL